MTGCQMRQHAMSRRNIVTDKKKNKIVGNEKPALKQNESDVSFSWEKLSTKWHNGPDRDIMPSELIAMEKRHRLRALACVGENGNMKVSAGPELTISEDDPYIYRLHNDTPNSTIGLGLQLNIDF